MLVVADSSLTGLIEWILDIKGLLANEAVISAKDYPRSSFPSVCRAEARPYRFDAILATAPIESPGVQRTF
jgi:hypothetical protein